jgi:hypothetical protein
MLRDGLVVELDVDSWMCLLTGGLANAMIQLAEKPVEYKE